MVKIHPTAIVDTKASLGENVEIGPFSIIEKNVEIGENVIIGPRCTVYEGSVI
ncbi:MAG: acyl-[acyl-carrier-protein]--UDP-N-acetylglucosamine O-acyltransferase, partial [Bacillota bacterium]